MTRQLKSWARPTAISAIFSLFISIAIASDLPPQSREQIIDSAERVGHAMIVQGQSPADIQKLIASYVKNEYARQVDPQNPGAPLAGQYDADVNSIVNQVLKNLNDAQPVQPTPVVVPPARPAVNPTPPPGPQPKPAQPGPNHRQNQNTVWVFVPLPPPAPSPVAALPVYAPIGQPPVINIHRSWFGHPTRVWYSSH